MDVQQVLREALDEQATGAPRADSDLFERALGRRRARRHRIAGVLGAAVVVGGLVGGIVGLGASGDGNSPATAAAAAGGPSGAAGGMSLEEQRTQLAAELGVAEPPAVDVIRVVVPEERDELVEQCLLDRGWTGTEDGGVFFEIPADREEAWNLDNYICMSSYPIDPDRGGTWTDTQTAIQYDWTINTVLPCLDALGYTVTVPPPSRAEFIDTWWEDPYFPFAHVEGITGLSNAQFDQLENQCPQSAPTDQLWD